MSGIYTVSFEKVSVIAVQDLFAIVAHSANVCVLQGFTPATASVKPCSTHTLAEWATMANRSCTAATLTFSKLTV